MPESTAPNHNTELWIYQMVLNRLPFLEDTDTNKTLLSHFTLEIMNELDTCFKKGIDLPEGEESKVGFEGEYSVLQRTIVADLVAYYILFRMMIANMGGSVGADGTLTPATGKFLSRTKAGSVEAEWEQFDVKKGGMITTGDKLMETYKMSAIRKARTIMCVIDICDDCSLSVSCLIHYEPHPFKVRPDGLGLSGDHVVERN